MSAGGARAPLDGAAVGGFTLTLAPLRIKCVLCRHILSHLASGGSSTFDRDVPSCLLPTVRRVLGVAVVDGGVDGEAPGWGAGVSLRSHCRCPVTLMGADGSKNRKVSTIFPLLRKMLFYSTGLQPCNSWINCVKSQSTWSSKISVWTIGELDTLQHMQWCWKRCSGRLTHFCVQMNCSQIRFQGQCHIDGDYLLWVTKDVSLLLAHNILHGWLHSSCTTLLQICCAAQGEGGFCDRITADWM